LRCVYTVLTGGYERLNEQPAARDSNIPFICLTDDPALHSDTYEIRGLRRMFPSDPIRSQRGPKLLPHLYLPEFDASIYIDNSVRLLAPPERLFEAADPDAGLSLPAHSFRDTLLGEFEAVAEEKLDDPARIAEQLAHYRADFPDILNAKPFWNGILVRAHRHPAMREAMQIWFAHLCRYARRDQLSGPVAFHLAGLTPKVLAIDNYQSPFHTWPHATERLTAQRLWPDAPAADGRDGQIETLRAQVAALTGRLAALSDAHQTVLRARSARR